MSSPAPPSRVPLAQVRPAPAAPDRGSAPLTRALSSWGWLLAGLGLCAAGVLIPVNADLAHAERERDRALAQLEALEHDLDRHQRYLDALHRREPELLAALAERHTRTVVGSASQPVHGPPAGTGDIDIFLGLEPAPVRPVPQPTPPGSLLARIAADPTGRAALVSIGGVFVFVGALPTVRRPGRR